MNQKILDEVREIVEGGTKEIIGEKKVFFDKKTNQFSIKIPKSLALKAGLDENSVFEIVFNINKEETKRKVDKSKLVLYTKGVVVGEGREG